MSKRPDTKKRISLGVSQKKRDATMDRLLKRPKRTKLDREVDEGLSAIDRALAKRMLKPARRQRTVKMPAHSARKTFVYAADLRPGDMIETADSMPTGDGSWEQKTVRGTILSVDKTSYSAYSQTLVMLQDADWPDTTEERRMRNESFVLVLNLGG